MGLNAYIVEHKKCNLGGGEDFYEIIERNFTNDEGEVYLDTYSWKDLLEDDRTIIERFPEEVKEVDKDLEENGGCVTYAFL